MSTSGEKGTFTGPLRLDGENGKDGVPISGNIAGTGKLLTIGDIINQIGEDLTGSLATVNLTNAGISGPELNLPVGDWSIMVIGW